MNIPFEFALSNTTPYGVLWNPWGATVPTSVANITIPDDPAPTGAVRLIGYNVQSDADDCEVSFGIYDTEAEAFEPVQPVYATALAAGGLTRTMLGAGLLLTVSATRIPVLAYTPISGSAGVTGDVELFAQQPVTLGTPGSGGINPPVLQVLDEAYGQILDEASGPIINE